MEHLITFPPRSNDLVQIPNTEFIHYRNFENPGISCEGIPASYIQSFNISVYLHSHLLTFIKLHLKKKTGFCARQIPLVNSSPLSMCNINLFMDFWVAGCCEHLSFQLNIFLVLFLPDQCI